MSSQRDRRTPTHKAPATHLLGGRGSGGGGPPGLHEQGLSCQQRVLHEAQISPRPAPASIPCLRHLGPDSGLERDPALALPMVWKSPRPVHESPCQHRHLQVPKTQAQAGEGPGPRTSHSDGQRVPPAWPQGSMVWARDQGRSACGGREGLRAPDRGRTLLCSPRSEEVSQQNRSPLGS